jgi:hypothetical protein
MSEEPGTQTKTEPTGLGVYRQSDAPAPVGAIEVIGAALSLLWLLGAGVFFIVVPSEGQISALAIVMTVIAVVLPVGLIAIAISAARAHRLLRDETSQMKMAVDAMRTAYITGQQGAGTVHAPSASERKLDEVIATQRQIEGQLAELRKATGAGIDPLRPATKNRMTAAPEPATKTMAPVPQTPSSDQPSLALGTPGGADGNPVSVEDFIRAIHFPQSETDKEGFRALRAALRDPSTATLVRAAQDVLTLLSEDGIYMDDFTPDRTRPEVWRRFAAGERGPGVAALGGIRDRSCLALTAGRMRNDAVFRDTAHHFLRRFDTIFSRFAEAATDAEIAALSETRTARAFMLIGRVTGTFD